MKNLIKLLIVFISLISLSCDDDVQDTGTVTAETGLKLLTPNSTFNLAVDATKLTELATTFVWNDTDNQTGTSITYTIEAAKAGTNFAAPVTIGTTSNHYLNVTNGDLDVAAKTSGLQPLVEGQMDVRIKTATSVSNYFTIKIIPYQPNWGIIGSSTAQGWNNSTDMTFNPITGNYSISTMLAAGEFKFRLDNSWTVNLGDDGNNLTLENGGANIPVTTPGNYTIVLNLNTNSYTITPIPNAWGVIGDATPTGSSDDTLMDYDPVTQKYSIVMKMTAGSFKFRLDHSWTTNYGDDGNNLSLDAGGANLQISSPGTYLINADFTGLTYTITQL